MKRKNKILWIDDESKRERTAKNLENSLNIKVHFFDISTLGMTMNEVIGELKTNFPPQIYDLIIIDHFLNKVEDDNIKKGTIIAEKLREDFSKIPLLGVSAAIEKINLSQRKLYVDILPYEKISKYYLTIKSILKSFEILNQKSLNNINKVLELFIAPEIDKEMIIKIFPDELKKNFEDKSYNFRFSKWMRKIFLIRPGFVYDKLWAATSLGLNEKGFEKVLHLFKNAGYNGIFADESNPKWWKSSLKEIVYNKVKLKSYEPTWILGELLKDIDKNDLSKCYSCGKAFPETVGFTDNTAKKAVPLHFDCSEPHPNFEQMLYFEEIRKMNNG